MASLGALPPGKRVIEYTHEYTKTYRNTYYQVVDTEWADQLEQDLHENQYWEYDEFSDDARDLADLEAECYDSTEVGEAMVGVELLQATVKYDPSDQDQREAVERGWHEHYKQQKIDDLDIESPRLIADAVKCAKECDQLDRDYLAVKKQTA
jgi:hypothetical protein